MSLIPKFHANRFTVKKFGGKTVFFRFNDYTTSTCQDTSPIADGSTGPCLEYLLKHNLLDLLATLAVSDDPPGMRQYVLRFVTNTLTHLQAPILAHNAVFPSLQRLIEMCNGHCPTPSETDEIKFLFALTAQLRKHPHLVYVYMNQWELRERKLSECSTTSNHSSSSLKTLTSSANIVPADLPMVHTRSSPPPNNPLFRPLVTPALAEEPKLVPVEVETTTLPPPQPPPDDPDSSLPQFPLLNALISYINSADSAVRVKACQAIMLVTSVPDDKFAQLIAQHSPLCESLAIKLTAQYLEIPPDTDPNHIDDMHATWGLLMARVEPSIPPSTNPLPTRKIHKHPRSELLGSASPHFCSESNEPHETLMQNSIQFNRSPVAEW
ncbi:hypothetical protein J6590_027485 [Homalodisca vitripennis]|nr:hypothetical protein J6590_027485 [Homalodisca vitripennis]